MPVEPSIDAGARQIVQRCLDLKPGQQFVIFADETTVEPGVVIAQAAESLGVSPTVILVSVASQQRIPLESDLSFLAQRAARDARAILTCVNALPDCLPFRERILETHWTAHTKIGHMPGASLQVLALANVDYEKLVADCRCLEITMARGKRLELISHTSGGVEHRLVADVGGWERLPVASDGIISDGAWGNVPSGETYIAPMEGSSEGSIVINGAIPGLVIAPGQEIVLSFERGRLTRIEPEDGPAARWLHETQISRAKARGDLYWSNLAEIGVGLNPAVEALTGNMLFDEKAAGTAHVALGSNIFMGGMVDASIHCDMVTRAPTIQIDGKMVIEAGRLAYVESEWHEHYSHISLQESPLQAASEVARSGVQAVQAADGRLQRILRPEPGRVSACLVGNPETARMAYNLYRQLPEEGTRLSLSELASSARMDQKVARQILHLLWQYELVNVW
ncbi:MAG: aminopeptidase [Anaerolineae bacterium]|jgi:leucyl aminopeptidase (aminopeptidase T)